jgi:hypothetical protein
MGIMYGVDVGDGAGVRSTATSYDDNAWYEVANTTWGDAPQPSLERLDAFAEIVNAQAPFDVGELCGKPSEALSVGDHYGHAADVFDVSMLTVAELIGEWGSEPIKFVLQDPMLTTASWDLALVAEPSITRDDKITSPAHHAGFEIDEYFIVSGQPRRIDGLVVNVDAKTGIGNRIRQIETFPEPRNVNLAADARWLPLRWTLDPFMTYWAPYSGFDPGPCKGLTVQELKDDLVGGCRDSVQYLVQDFLTGGDFYIKPTARQYFTSVPGTNPKLLPRYDYYRAGGFVRSGAVGMRQGRHMWCDQINWNAEEVTVIIAAVLHEPQNEWSGILEVESSNEEQLEPFFGIRYHRSGVLGLWADSLLASVPIEAGIPRPAQPIIVGLNIDMKDNTVSMLSVDRDVKVQTTSLPHRYDNRSRLWLGRSPFGDDATASMEILEVSYWTQRFGLGDLVSLLGQYDRMYGVTTS